ncbi:hypothetical protein H696_04419 [Fonticula alba]|uniref:Uncharacterized protein n=1 Tax=Fonticula alba TaxID=691883 RepID=A0A058Z408_FONAL|nr:hypothetical protein H696_04419 [Fonticula alba]KCV68999.1 hypothetical protein H696_04419 [Fonticula alba]|eukprot:XP_009496570.1 hypothetical protein H696_04419 [Fonticula alba]
MSAGTHGPSCMCLPMCLCMRASVSGAHRCHASPPPPSGSLSMTRKMPAPSPPLRRELLTGLMEPSRGAAMSPPLFVLHRAAGRVGESVPCLHTQSCTDPV